MNRIRGLWLVAVLLVCSLTVRGHHIRGIPHYSYSESYPTAPTFEEVREVDNLTLRMTYYAIPGSKAVDLALYIKDRRTGKPYSGKVVYSVFGEKEDPTEAHSVTALLNKNNIYKAGWVYEEDGLYYVRVQIGDNAALGDEAFRMQIGEPTVNYWLLGGVAGGILVLIIAVALIKRAQGDKSGDETGPAEAIGFTSMTPATEDSAKTVRRNDI